MHSSIEMSQQYHQTLDDYLSALRESSQPCEVKSLSGV
jgi:hypothetical protein